MDGLRRALARIAGQQNITEARELKSCMKNKRRKNAGNSKNGHKTKKKRKKQVRFDNTAESAWQEAN